MIDFSETIALQHILNISGGKDSTACYLLALQRGVPFRPVMADTGNEHPYTIAYAMSLGERTGGPQVEIYRADFTDRLARKRKYIAKHWPEEWARTDRGGKQFNWIIDQEDDGLSCSSQYGLCE